MFERSHQLLNQLPNTQPTRARLLPACTSLLLELSPPPASFRIAFYRHGSQSATKLTGTDPVGLLLLLHRQRKTQHTRFPHTHS